ncbi:MAG: sensor histidine kinase [Chthoniobacter sp.]|uniref:HAMP domain-containing sensor histidine kinase n=1 Tax=Chthoniobacter sp. TaxID=2510640 RepID=UPI0032A1E53E
MSFPPPARFYVPMLVFVFGLATTWFEFELNLANDLSRNRKEVLAEMDATGERMARRSGRQAEHGEAAMLAEDLATWAHQPWLKEAALVNDQGVVIDDSEKRWEGRPASETPLAPAMKLAAKEHEDTTQTGNHSEEGTLLYGAYPFAIGAHETAWALVVFDHASAVQQAMEDARYQRQWVAAAITLLCLCLWVGLHFGFAARLARLTRAVRDYGDGRANSLVKISGGDEVHELSIAFAAMGARLAEREAERVRLERVILDTSEREQRRIGADLHDGLGQQLTAASLATNGLITALGSAAPSLVPQAESLGRQLRETIAEVRALSHGLAPVSLADDGLMHALHELAEATARSARLRCIFDCPQPVQVSDVVLAGHLYRVAQEAVNNALKHAAAKEIRIGLERRGATLVLEVEDDGDGLPETPTGDGGIGLSVMRHRLKLVSGTLEIGSSPAGGTRVACFIPSSS